jgi:hypothetical protein
MSPLSYLREYCVSYVIDFLKLFVICDQVIVSIRLSLISNKVMTPKTFIDFIFHRIFQNVDIYTVDNIENVHIGNKNVYNRES